MRGLLRMDTGDFFRVTKHGGGCSGGCYAPWTSPGGLDDEELRRARHDTGLLNKLLLSGGDLRRQGLELLKALSANSFLVWAHLRGWCVHHSGLSMEYRLLVKSLSAQHCMLLKQEIDLPVPILPYIVGGPSCGASARVAILSQMEASERNAHLLLAITLIEISELEGPELTTFKVSQPYP